MNLIERPHQFEANLFLSFGSFIPLPTSKSGLFTVNSGFENFAFERMQQMQKLTRITGGKYYRDFHIIKIRVFFWGVQLPYNAGLK